MILISELNKSDLGGVDRGAPVLFRGKMPTNKQQGLLHSLEGSQEGLGSVAVQLRGRRGMGGWRVKKKGWLGGLMEGKRENTILFSKIWEPSCRGDKGAPMFWVNSCLLNNTNDIYNFNCV